MKYYFFDNFSLFHLPVFIFAKIVGARIIVFDFDLNLRNKKFFRYLERHDFLTREIEQHALQGDSHTKAIKHSEKIVEKFKNNKLFVILINYFRTEDVTLVFKKKLAEELVKLTSIDHCITNRLQEQNITAVYFPVRTIEGIQLIGRKNLDSASLGVKIVTPISLFTMFRKMLNALTNWMLLSLYIFHIFLQKNKSKKQQYIYKFGISLSAPFFTKFKGKRAFDFLLNKENLCKKDSVFIVEYKDDVFIKNMRKNGYNIISKPGASSIVNSFWRILTRRCVTNSRKVYGDIYFAYLLVVQYSFAVRGMRSLLFEQMSWNDVLTDNVIGKYIYTNKDSSMQVAANIVLRNKNIKSISYSQFIGGTYQIDNKYTGFDNQNVLFAFLNCDTYIVNNDAMKSSLLFHPNRIGEVVVSGNVFSQLINEIVSENQAEVKNTTKKIMFFDTSYIDIDFLYSSFNEAICFLEQIIRVAKELPNNLYYFKSSKDNDYFIGEKQAWWVSSEKGKKILELRTELKHMKNVSYQNTDKDTVELIVQSDLVITNCFSSLVADAASSGIDSFWHDAKQTTVGFPLDEIPEMVTHGYDELLERILKSNDSIVKELWSNDSYKKLIDPYNDGKALDRVRQIIVNG